MRKKMLPVAKCEPELNAHDALDPVVLSLLDRMPLRWKVIDADGMTATEQEALKLLTAGGLVERRLFMTLSDSLIALSVGLGITGGPVL